VETPECVDLLLSDSQKLRLINKLCKAPLCVRQGNVLVCCDSQHVGEQLFTVTVDPDTALTTFSFLSGHLAEQGGVAIVAEAGTRWMLKPIDENHVKIFTTDGNLHFNSFISFLKNFLELNIFLNLGSIFFYFFVGKYLTASKTLSPNITEERVVCLMLENDFDEQLWKVEEVMPKESKLVESRKRSHEGTVIKVEVQDD
jgi:hypothetical protein